MGQFSIRCQCTGTSDSVTSADHFLYFYVPCLSLRDVRIALQFVGQYDSRPKGARPSGETREDFFVLLRTYRRTFDDYQAIEKALRDCYGFKKEDQKSGEKENTQVQIKKALFRESALKGLDWSQKQKVLKVEKIFKGRIL